MAFDVVMFGSLTLPETNVEEWLVTPFEPREFVWIDELDGVEPPHETPEALLASLEQHLTMSPHELFFVTLQDGRLDVSCYVSEDTYRETTQALALLFGSAASYGGVGELHFAGYQGIRFGERITVRAGRSLFSRLMSEDLARLEQHKQFRSLDAKIHERFDSLVGRPASSAETNDPRRSRWVINPFTGRKVRVADSHA
ncbi:MAG: hypothetical protein JNM17_40645 [Archangium sp.]|nr:hypothetical protein [Archangium sp.]